MYELVRISRENPVEVEGHIEAPEDSSLFQKYPRILESTAFVEMICDTIRSMLMNFDDVYQVEELLDKQLDGMKEEALHGSHALQNVACAETSASKFYGYRRSAASAFLAVAIAPWQSAYSQTSEETETTASSQNPSDEKEILEFTSPRTINPKTKMARLLPR